MTGAMRRFQSDEASGSIRSEIATGRISFMPGVLDDRLQVGDLVRVRAREWVVEAPSTGVSIDGPQTVDLACIDDDAQGERLSIVVGSEIDFRRVEGDLWDQIAREGSDDPEVLGRTFAQSRGVRRPPPIGTCSRRHSGLASIRTPTSFFPVKRPWASAGQSADRRRCGPGRRWKQVWFSAKCSCGGALTRARRGSRWDDGAVAG